MKAVTLNSKADIFSNRNERVNALVSIFSGTLNHPFEKEKIR